MSDIHHPARMNRWLVLSVAVVGTVLSFGLLALLLLPALTSVTAVEVVEDPKMYQIGTVAEIEPEEGWSVQPTLGEGQLLRSPDRMLAVLMRPAVPDDQLEGQLLVETLSNEAELTHVTVGAETMAMLWLPDGGPAILVEATVDDRADPGLYRAQLAELLLHVKPLG